MIEFFNENILTFRTFMLTFGWIILISSSIILIYKAAELYKKIRHIALSKFIVPALLGWIITMYSLGAVCTFYVFDEPYKGMLVAFPIFLIWAVSIFIIFLITHKSGAKIIEQSEGIMKLNTELTKANSQLQQLDGMKSEFINITAHQLRTPLTEIRWSLETAINGDAGSITNEQKELLSKGALANERIIKIVNTLLKVGKIEESKWDYNFKRASIEKIVEEVVISFTPIAGRKKINLFYKKIGRAIPDIEMDSVKINILLSILIENALDYTPENGNVSVLLRSREEDVEIAIQDSGIGISREEQERLFTRFFRSSRAIRIKTDGTGVGLYIAKNIVNTHKGKIWVESGEGKGTTFHFTIPVDRSEE